MSNLAELVFSKADTDLFALFGIGVVLTLVAGFYGLVTTRNLVRALINLEILTKGVTLVLILAGYLSRRMALAQALAITLIILEVAVIVVGVGIVLCIHKRTGEINAELLRNVKG